MKQTNKMESSEHDEDLPAYLDLVTVSLSSEANHDQEINTENYDSLVQTPLLLENQNFNTFSDDSINNNSPNEDNHHSITILDPSTSPPSLARFEIPGLGGATDDIFLSLVYLYLTAKDLCILSQSSRYFRDITSKAKVWTSLFNRDFFYHDVSFSTVIMTRPLPRSSIAGYLPLIGNNHLSPILSSGQPNAISSSIASREMTKLQYIEQYKTMKIRTNEKTQQNRSFQRSINTDRIKRHTEQFLEITQIRIMIPLPFAASFISLLLVGLKYSGYDISIWFCSIPVLFYLIYILACGIVAWYVKRNEFDHNSVCYGLWPMFQGPVELCFPRNNSRSSVLVTALFVFVIILCILEVLLITLKMSLSPQPGGSQSYSTNINVSWAAAFTPLWVVFGLFCLLPLSGLLRAESGYDWWQAGLILVWIPFFIFAVCLVVKLSYEDAGDYDKANNIRLALVMMPFWVFEGIVMLTSLAFLCDGCIK